MCLGVPQAAAEALLPIDEGPEYDYLQAPGQLSDADDEEPWIPDPHKPKAARTLNFDLVASTDVCAAHAQPPAGSCSIPATEQEGPNNNAATGAVQTGQGKPSDDHRLHDKQAVPDVEKAAPDRHCQPQREPHNVRTRETAGISKTPASAQRRKKQARQQRLEPELGKEAGGAAKSFHEEAAPVGHGGKAARVGHAGSGKTQQTTASMHRTTPNPRAQMAGQVKTKIVCCTLTHADSLTSVVQSLFASDMELSCLCGTHLPRLSSPLTKKYPMSALCRSRALAQQGSLHALSLRLGKLWRGAKRLDSPLHMRGQPCLPRMSWNMYLHDVRLI